MRARRVYRHRLLSPSEGAHRAGPLRNTTFEMTDLTSKPEPQEQDLPEQVPEGAILEAALNPARVFRREAIQQPELPDMTTRAGLSTSSDRISQWYSEWTFVRVRIRFVGVSVDCLSIANATVYVRTVCYTCTAQKTRAPLSRSGHSSLYNVNARV